MKKSGLIIVLAGFFALSSCNLDYLPDEMLTPEQIEKDPASSVYVTDGNYAMFKDLLEYKGSSHSGSSYVRYYFELAEQHGDNICLSGRTTNPLFQAIRFERSDNLRNTTYLWWCSYKIINGANTMIESIQEGINPESDHLLGENYFMRGLVYFHLSTLWSKQYVQGQANIGVVKRTNSTEDVFERSTVGEIYDLVVDDLKNAMRLMSGSSRRGNSGYMSREAVQGILSRVYLYMGENAKVIELVDEMLAGASPESKLEPTETYPDYFAKALESKETLWAIAHTKVDSRGTGAIGSMYLTDGLGWGEIYASDPLLDLLDRNPNDVRYKFIRPAVTSENDYMIRWAVQSESDFYQNEIRDVDYDSDVNKYYFNEGAGKIYVETEKVNGYGQYYIHYNGTKLRVRISKKMEIRNTYPKYFVLKYSYQDDDPMLSSPVVIRWAEVILNRAEAYAKLNNATKALEDVNVIRKRAGLSGKQLFSSSNMMGYSDILDVVLDERRLELCFEGHRAFDLFRNQKTLDRRYVGIHPWETVKYTDNKIQYFIPADEITISKIPQND